MGLARLYSKLPTWWYPSAQVGLPLPHRVTFKRRIQYSQLQVASFRSTVALSAPVNSSAACGGTQEVAAEVETLLGSVPGALLVV